MRHMALCAQGFFSLPVFLGDCPIFPHAPFADTPPENGFISFLLSFGPLLYDSDIFVKNKGRGRPLTDVRKKGRSLYEPNERVAHGIRHGPDPKQRGGKIL